MQTNGPRLANPHLIAYGVLRWQGRVTSARRHQDEVILAAYIASSIHGAEHTALREE